MLHAVQFDDKWMLWWKHWFKTGFQYIMTFIFSLVYSNNYIQSRMQCTACFITFSHNKDLCPTVRKLLIWRSNIRFLIYFMTEIMLSCPILLCSVIKVQDGSRIKAPPNLRRPKHFCNIDHNVHGATVVSIDRWILWEWSQSSCRLQA